MPSITATCITQRLRACGPGDDTPSGIDKGGVDGIVATPGGVEGDSVLDTHNHGGKDKALYLYADEDAAWWEQRLGIAIPPGRFGENLRSTGIDVGALVLGTRLTVGTQVEVEVREPRVPCGTFRHHMGDRAGWVKEFTAANRTGAYLQVHVGGPVTAGDEVTVTHVPDHGVTLAGWFGANDPDDGRALLAAADGGWDMPASLRAYVEHVLRGA